MKKCSFRTHNEIDAINYCLECKVFMCNKCEKFHSDLCQNHHSYSIDKDINEIFTGFCKEENHLNKLDYYCKNHNKLCCAACISKIVGKGNGQHKDCEICFIEDIKENKKSNLKENIKYLNELSNILESSINELKLIFQKINDNKEKIKQNIQNVFTKIRTILNDREDILLQKVDETFNNLYFDEKIIKNTEK